MGTHTARRVWKCRLLVPPTGPSLLLPVVRRLPRLEIQLVSSKGKGAAPAAPRAAPLAHSPPCGEQEELTTKGKPPLRTGGNGGLRGVCFGVGISRIVDHTSYLVEGGPILLLEGGPSDRPTLPQPLLVPILRFLLGVWLLLLLLLLGPLYCALL